MVRLPLDCPDSAVVAFAETWTDLLAEDDYAAAFAMLRHVPEHPGKSWADTPDELRTWVGNCGSDEPIEGEPEYRVTPIELAVAERPEAVVDRDPSNAARYAGCVGRLDWPLPLNGEWSDLTAAFDLVSDGTALTLVLVAVDVP